MAKIGRPGMSDAQKREVWQRWKAGQSLSDIARALGKVPGSIHHVVASNGGYVPADRKRAAGALTLADREEISRGLARGSRSGRSRPGWAARPRRSAGRWDGTVAVSAIGPHRLMRVPGTTLAVPSGACFSGTPSCVRWWPPGWPRTGHPSRSPAG